MAEYPPLTSVKDYPLHPGGIYERPSWACSTPEKPRDGQTNYDWRCSVCVLAAQAHIVNQGDSVMQWTQTAGAAPVERELSWMVARSLWWFDNDGAEWTG